MAMNAAAVVAASGGVRGQTVRLSSRCSTRVIARTSLHHTPRNATWRQRVPFCESGCQHALRMCDANA